MDKVVELVGGGSVSTGPNPSSFLTPSLGKSSGGMISFVTHFKTYVNSFSLPLQWVGNDFLGDLMKHFYKRHLSENAFLVAK